MTANVVGLRGAAVVGSREPDADVVERLEALLAKAKEGRIHGLAYVSVIDDIVTNGWVGKAVNHYMLSGASILQWRIAQNLDEASE